MLTHASTGCKCLSKVAANMGGIYPLHVTLWNVGVFFIQDDKPSSSYIYLRQWSFSLPYWKIYAVDFAKAWMLLKRSALVGRTALSPASCHSIVSVSQSAWYVSDEICCCQCAVIETPLTESCCPQKWPQFLMCLDAAHRRHNTIIATMIRAFDIQSRPILAPCQ